MSPPLHTSAAAGGSPGLLRRAWEVCWAILRERCPRCHRGPLFRGLFGLNDPCPVCGLIIQREEGYFLGAMYVSYILSAGLLTIFYILASVLLPGWNGILVALAAMVPYIPLSPFVLRYSRVLWIYFDRASDYGNVSAGPYEKARLRQMSEEKASGRPPSW